MIFIQLETLHLSKNIYVTSIYFNSYFLLTISRNKEILKASKQKLVGYAVIYRIDASIVDEENMTTCNFVIQDKKNEEKFDVFLKCDNDKVMKLLVKKIAS